MCEVIHGQLRKPFRDFHGDESKMKPNKALHPMSFRAARTSLCSKTKVNSALSAEVELTLLFLLIEVVQMLDFKRILPKYSIIIFTEARLCCGFFALTALTIWRSQHHMFAPDGGA